MYSTGHTASPNGPDLDGSQLESFPFALFNPRGDSLGASPLLKSPTHSGYNFPEDAQVKVVHASGNATILKSWVLRGWRAASAFSHLFYQANRVIFPALKGTICRLSLYANSLLFTVDLIDVRTAATLVGILSFKTFNKKGVNLACKAWPILRHTNVCF